MRSGKRVRQAVSARTRHAAARDIAEFDGGAGREPGQVDHTIGNPARPNGKRRSHAERTGRADTAALTQDWNFYLAYNLFRIAAILQGIAKRVVDGTAASAQAREAGASARPLAALGWSFAARS